MAQKREKDETLELKVPSETPLSLSCPDNCKKLASQSSSSSSSSSSNSSSNNNNNNNNNNSNINRPDMGRVDPGSSELARPRSEREGQAQAHVEAQPETRAEVKGEDHRVEVRVAAVAKRAVNRCSGCGKRVGLTGFRCRCGDLFCAEHRYSDRHDCSYDYKSAGREAIARENPVVRAAKILKV